MYPSTAYETSLAPCEEKFSHLLVTPAATDPLLYTDVLSYSRISTTSEYAELTRLISVATQDLQARYDMQFVTATWRLYLDHFPIWSRTNPSCAIRFRKWPVSSVSSVKYLDTTGTEQTWSSGNYLLDANSKPAKITPAYGIVYPSTYSVPNAVYVDFVAGFGVAAAVPSNIKQAIYLHVAGGYEERNPTTDKAPSAIANGIDALMSSASWGSLL